VSSEEMAVRVRGLSVRYGATLALDGVALDVARGSVHAVVGENGAGKTTLLRVLAGLCPGHAGRVVLAGGAAAPRNPGEARRLGIGLAEQEIEVCPELRAVDQVTLGLEPGVRAGRRARIGWIDRRRQNERAAALLERVGARFPPETPLQSLGATGRKQVQIARALAGDPRLLLLDEPTAALDAAGAAIVVEVLRDVARAGGAALLVSHRIDEVLACADVVSILRDGRHVFTGPAREQRADDVVRRMVGREIPARAARAVAAPGDGDVALAWDGDVPLRVRRGEVVGLAGLVGAGRSETLEAIARAHPGRCALVPEERARKGLVPTFNVRENLFLPAPGRILRRARERADADGWIARLGIRVRSGEDPIASLSGGNQQKVLLARALARRTGVVLLDEPTQGVDVGAKAEIHACIRGLADAGSAVVMASSDLPELLHLADRIVVLREGRSCGEVDPTRAGEAEVIALATGLDGGGRAADGAAHG